VYVAIRRYKINPGSNPEIARVATEGYLPIISTVPGFIAYYGIEAADDEYVAVAVFEDRTGAEESTRVAADFIRENLTPLLPTPPDITEGKVSVHQTGGTTSGVRTEEVTPRREEASPTEQESYRERAWEEEGRRLVEEVTDRIFDRFLGGQKNQGREESGREKPPREARGDEPPR
jgi:antibiotic biosynthesis monooxygenase